MKHRRTLNFIFTGAILTLCALMLFSDNSRAQTIHYDSSINGKQYCNVLYTDNSMSLINIPLKLHIEICDMEDSENGATFSYSLYPSSATMQPPIQTNSVPCQNGCYTEWDANSETWAYTYIQEAFATKGIQIIFQQ